MNEILYFTFYIYFQVLVATVLLDTVNNQSTAGSAEKHFDAVMFPMKELIKCHTEECSCKGWVIIMREKSTIGIHQRVLSQAMLILQGLCQLNITLLGFLLIHPLLSVPCFPLCTASEST